MSKEDYLKWFSKGINIGYSSGKNKDKSYSGEFGGPVPIEAMFDKIWTFEYPDRSHECEWYETSWGAARCRICERSSELSRWYCPKSEDHLCHYEDSTKYGCDYCGAPEERK